MSECMRCKVALYGEIEKETGLCCHCADREYERHVANREWEYFHDEPRQTEEPSGDTASLSNGGQDLSESLRDRAVVNEAPTGSSPSGLPSLSQATDRGYRTGYLQAWREWCCCASDLISETDFLNMERRKERVERRLEDNG